MNKTEKSKTRLYTPGSFSGFYDKWAKTSEFKTAQEVRSRFEAMWTAQDHSCPFPQPLDAGVGSSDTDSDTSRSAFTGSSWRTYWRNCYRAWSMWKEYIEGRSNLKSPLSFASVEAAYSDFLEQNIGVSLKATNPEDEGKVAFYSNAIRSIQFTSDARWANAASYHEGAITGTSFTHVCVLNKEREVEIILNDKEVEKEVSKALDKNDGEEVVNETVNKNKKPLTKKQKITEYNGIAYIPISVFEMFVDPAARCLRGPAYEAIDCAWRTIPSIDQFLAEFKHSKDPYVIKDNVKKVKPASDAQKAYGNTAPFFEAPDDLANDKEQIELIRYYNKQTDKYIIIANDVVVRDGPLPYNHKQLPFSVKKFIAYPNLLYGMGIPGILTDIQAELETQKNMRLDNQKIGLNPPLFVNTSVSNDLIQAYEQPEPGSIVPVNGSVGPENIRWMEAPSYPNDVYQMRNVLVEEAMAATGINSAAYAVPKAGEPVRNNVMIAESTQKMIKKTIYTWSEGYLEDVYQTIALIKQFWPNESKIDPETGERVFKSIRVEGAQLELDEMGNLVEKRKDGYSFFEVKDDYIDLKGDLEVEIDLDSIMPASRAVRLTNVQQALQILPGLLSNPQIMQAPGMNDLIKEYLKNLGFDKNITSQLQDSSSEDEVKSAQEQQAVMIMGSPVPGMPGESEAHKMAHTIAVVEVMTKLKGLTSDPMQQPDPAMISRLEMYLQNLTDHLQIDNTPKNVAPMMVSQPPAQGAPPPEESMPMSPEMSMGVNQPIPPIGG